MRVLGLDLGQRRIGVALSDPTGTIAQGHEVLQRGGLREVIEQIRQRVERFQVDRIVVGLPRRLDGTEGVEAERARRFAARLQTAIPVPVDMYDEWLSTVAAERIMRAHDVSRIRRRERRDAVAAALILQSYLDRHR